MSIVQFSTKLRGVVQTARELEMVATAVRDQMGEELAATLTTITLPVAEDTCPVDTGALQKSGFVDGPEIHALGARVTIGFGRQDVFRPAGLSPKGIYHGSAAPTSSYAFEQHETNPTQPKWLEHAVMETLPTVLAIVRQRLGSNLPRVRLSGGSR